VGEGFHRGRGIGRRYGYAAFGERSWEQVSDLARVVAVQPSEFDERWSAVPLTSQNAAQRGIRSARQHVQGQPGGDQGRRGYVAAGRSGPIAHLVIVPVMVGSVRDVSLRAGLTRVGLYREVARPSEDL
jgi:hypothetical protein